MTFRQWTLEASHSSLFDGIIQFLKSQHVWELRARGAALAMVPTPHYDTDQSRIVYLVRLISIWYCKWFMNAFHDTGHA